MAAPTASSTERTWRSLRVPESAGRAATTTPPIASTMPAMHNIDGITPLTIPMTTGMTTPSAATGATTPIVPTASA